MYAFLILGSMYGYPEIPCENPAFSRFAVIQIVSLEKNNSFNHTTHFSNWARDVHPINGLVSEESVKYFILIKSELSLIIKQYNQNRMPEISFLPSKKSQTKAKNRTAAKVVGPLRKVRILGALFHTINMHSRGLV